VVAGVKQTKSQLKTSEDMKNIEKSNETKETETSEKKITWDVCSFQFQTRWCPLDSVQLVNITPISLWFKGDISIVFMGL